MCWRIVRIQGDGSIKLILEDQNELCSVNMNGNWGIPLSSQVGAKTNGWFGYRKTAAGQEIIDYLNESGEAIEYDRSMATAFQNFQNDKLSGYLDKLKSGDWCLVDGVYNDEGELLNNEEKNNLITNLTMIKYDTWYRKTNNLPYTLKCFGTKMSKFGDNVTEMYVGTLTANEIMYAGHMTANKNNYTYLRNEYSIAENKMHFTFSPAYLESGNNAKTYLYWFGDGLGITANLSFAPLNFRPSIILKSNSAFISGDGTINKPYQIY